MNEPLPAEATDVIDAPRRSMWRRWRRRVAAAALSVVLATGAWNAGRWLATSPITRHVLRVRSIEVAGLVRTPREVALATAGLQMHQGILSVPMAQGVSALESLPWVRRAAIRRQMPDRVFVDVDEHRATLTAQLGELWLINTDGEPFKRFSAEDGIVLPMVTGLTPKAARDIPYEAQPALIARLKEAMVLADALAHCKDDIRQVEELHYDLDLGWSVVVVPSRFRAAAHEDDGVTVHLGTAPLERLPVLLAALVELSDRRLKARTIWAANERQAGRVQVELGSAQNT